MSASIASSLRDNRRLATFHIDRPQEFLAYLKTRYDSEVENWMYYCPKNDWKYPFLIREQNIRMAQKRIRYLEELAAEW